MNYKGYIIKDMTDTPESRWANEATIARGFKFAYCKGDILDEGTAITRTLDEAAAQIDELTANDPTPDDKMKIAVQCIEACREEFDYRAGHTGVSPEQHTVFIHHAQLCANALKAIQE